jgi:NAD(P)-dependent dehydrogenase (short-subunit alcohol dehydrogenase family)
MDDLKGKTAFITGGANGIGLAIARDLAREGVNLAIADVNEASLNEAAVELRRRGVKVVANKLDVSDRAAFYRVADEVEEELGDIHLVFNNAGISYKDSPLEEAPDSDIDWVVGVNLFGVLNGIKALVPKVKRHGQGGHIVNTASFLGLYLPPNQGRSLYSATKMGVIALSEGLRDSLAQHGIGVSVLCPSPVKTNIHSGGLHRPERFGGPSQVPSTGPVMAHDTGVAITPETVSQFVMEAIRNNDFLIITQPSQRHLFQQRVEGILAAFDRCDTLAARLEH